MDKNPCKSQDVEVRKGPWTVEEDLILVNYIANHGGGVWNALAKASGLKRIGKSCQLRWLNYLRPDVRRGNITLEEQLLIMELHAKWGSRWSKIAKHLPGRTDNEINNYWRTRIKKHTNKRAGMWFSQSNFELIDHQVSTSQLVCNISSTNFMETYSPPISSFKHCNIDEAFPQQQQNTVDQSNNESYWSTDMEDIWSMHLLNGDKTYI